MPENNVLRSLTATLITTLFATGAAAVDLDDGAHHTFDASDGVVSQIRVDLGDSGGTNQTSVTLLSGADIGQVLLEGQSALTVAAGASLDELIARDGSTTVLNGGTFPGAGGTYGSFDLANQASLEVFAGDFTCSGGRCILAHDESALTIHGGSFGGSATYGVLADTTGPLTIYGGDFTAGTFSSASVRTENTVSDIFGGLFDTLWSLNGSTMTLYGSGFEVVFDGGGSQSGFFAIPENKDGTITGILADGSPLDVVFSTGLGDSTMILAEAAVVPVPAALPLLASGVLGLGLAARRRRAHRAG